MGEAARILEQEHKIYPQAIQWIAEGRIKIVDRQVQIIDSGSTEGTLTNPSIP